MKIEQKGNVLVLGEGADATISTSKFVAYTTGATDAPKLVVENVDGNTAIRVEIEQVGDVRIGNTTGYTSFEDVVLELSKLPSFTKASATGGNSGGGVSPVSDTSWKREYVPLPANHQYAIRLKNNTETVISTALWSEVIVDVSCPREEAGKMTTCILVFSTEETVPRLNLPTNVVWRGETAPPLNPNTIYRLLFNIYEDKVLVNTF